MYLIHHTLFHHFYHYYRPSILIACGVLAITVCFAQAMRSLVEVPLLATRKRLRSATALATARAAGREGEHLSSAQNQRSALAEADTSALSIIRSAS